VFFEWVFKWDLYGNGGSKNGCFLGPKIGVFWV
jgi:hypothetical protein